MSKFLSRTIHVFLLFGIIPNCFTQPLKVQFEHLTIDQGLSHKFVMKIMEDRKGYLWFGTGNGLNKYDGYRFTNYKFDPFDSTSLPKNQVFTLWEDSEGIIWVGTSEGTSKFDPQTETFTRLERSAANPFAFKFAQSFNEDAEGNIWVSGSFEGQLRIIDRKTGKFSATNYAAMLEPESDNSSKTATKFHRSLHVIFKDRSGTLWVGSPSGLHRLNVKSGGEGKTEISFSHYRHDPKDSNSLSHGGVGGIYEDRSGILWIVTKEGALNAFDRKSGKFIRHEFKSGKLAIFYAALPGGITEDFDGNLWIGTTFGLYKINKKRNILETFFHDASEPGSLSNNFIFSVLTDKSGTLWVATPQGIDKIDPHKKPFSWYRNEAYNPHSLSQNKVAALWEDQQGVLWVGTTGGGLDALDKSTGQFTHYRHQADDAYSLRSDTASAILEDRNGGLWVGNGVILSRLNRIKRKFTHYKLKHPFISSELSSPIFTIYEDREGILWLGTNNGLVSFNPKTRKTMQYPYDPSRPERIGDWWALSILEDRKGDLWIGQGSQALTKLNTKTGKFTQYKTDIQKQGSLSSNTVPVIYEDSKGNLWFGTGEGGLCKFNYASETFITYTEKHGLAGNSVFSILEDNEGNLWLGTNNGLSKFSPAKQSFTNYDVADGLQSNLFTALYTEAAACKGKDGTLYFGGNNGFNAFNPADIRANSYVPPVVITQFRLFDKVVAGKHERKQIELNYDNNFFSFEFAALNYTSSHKNRYAYQLEGIDKDWVNSGTRRVATYTDIGPGNYIFKVRASNNDGVWNEKGITIRIVINPPWWLTPWAYTFYAICVFAALFAIHKFQQGWVIRNERERARDKELLQARELEKAYTKLKTTQTQLIQAEKMASLGALTSGIAHEIQNPLNFVNNFSDINTELIEELKNELGSNNRSEAILIADDIKENEIKINHHGKRADSIVKAMLQHSRTSSGEKEMKDINALVEEYLRLSYHGLRAKDKSFNAIMQTDYDESVGETEVIPQDLGRVFLNVFNNAFYSLSEKKTQVDGPFEPVVTVTTKRVADKIDISIKDNGTGISKQVVDKIYQPFFTTKPTGQGTGLGLSLSYDIIKAHGGEINVTSVDGEFTEFVIQLPVTA